LAANIKTHTQPHRSTGHLAGTIPRHRTQRRRDSQAYLHEPSVGLSTSTPRSPWDEDQALRSFRAQHRQFDRGSRDPLVLQEAQQQLPPSPGYPRCQSRTTTSRASRYAELNTTKSQQFNRGIQWFLSQSRPKINELIDVVTRKSRRSRRHKQDKASKTTALQLAQAEISARRQVTLTQDSLQATGAYGHAPRAKSAHTVRIAMENFNSLCVLSGNEKIMSLNNMCREYKVDILCGCETQIDWRQVPQSKKFQNLFGVGTETRSVVAHNINERMRPNQFGGCAMMAYNLCRGDCHRS
jgi:hypothetical protein